MSVPAEASIRQALEAINRGGLGTALLADPGTRRFAGLVTDGDIRRALLAGQGLESPLSAVPRPEPRTAPLGASPQEVSTLLTEAVRVVPLLDARGVVADLAVLDKRMHLPVAEPLLGEKELEYVTECVLTGWISSQGKFVTRFEQMFAEFCGTRHAVSASNGTTALHLALLAKDVGPGDEVVVPSLTFLATANCVRHAGGTPVIVDVEPDTWNLDPRAFEAAITPRTKAVVPVHLYGHPADMDPIMDVAARRGISVIEDAAEAHGATYKGRRVGGIGELGVFSFYGNKLITTGEGGMIVTDDAALDAKMRMLRDHGMSPTRRYWHPVLGYNYRLTNLQAAIGVAQMERVDDILSRKRAIAERYGQGLAGIPGIRLPPAAPWAQSVHWLYSILVEPAEFGMDRDKLMASLKAEGIETRPFFIPCHEQPVYASGQSLPVSEALSRKGLSLPSAATLRMDEVERVVSAIQKVAPR